MRQFNYYFENLIISASNVGGEIKININTKSLIIFLNKKKIVGKINSPILGEIKLLKKLQIQKKKVEKK